jgi:nucleotidyltransferase/DNA polymerase involved in DNA repair
VLIHLDADAFYVSVEQAERPELRGKAVAVGGLHRGIIASASYEARKFGVYTPMPSAKARRICPGLIMIRGDMSRYSRYSDRMFAIIEDFTPMIERTSIDEGYFDVSGHRTLSPMQIAQRMKARIRTEIGITVSLGIASNKLVAQIASKLRKPDALVEVPAGTERDFLAPLQSHWLPGVGAKLGARLKEVGLAYIRDIVTADIEFLRRVAGSYASKLQILAQGIDDRQVITEHDDAKSYGMQDTFGENLRDTGSVLSILQGMADKLMSRVRRDGKAIRTVTVKVRYPDFTDTSHGFTLPQPTDLETDVYPHLKALLRGAWRRSEPIRLASLRFSNVTDPAFQAELPLDSQTAQRTRQRDIARLLDEMRAKSLPVKRGHSL